MRFSYVRLAIAASAAAILIIGGWRAAPHLIWPLAAFLITAMLHARALNARDRAQSAVAFYERAIARVEGHWIGRGEQGERFRRPDHLYAEDLDLFGRGSLFELLSTARTRAGEDTLARWLLEPAAPGVVRDRQAAVRELGGKLDLREAIAILGDGARVGVEAPALRTWATAPVRLHGTGPRVLFVILDALTIAAIVYWATTGMPIPFYVMAGLDAATAAWFKPRVVAVIEAVDEPASDLDLLTGVLALIEQQRFESPCLISLHDRLGGSARLASAEIGRLEQLVALLSSRGNVMFALPAALMLWGTQFAFAIEAWRRRVGSHVPRWVDAIGEFEALSALATFASEHQDYAFPEFVDGPAVLRADRVAHPLLGASAVANAAALGGADPSLYVVSGSNMSGKSTFLRALGANVVLAHAGAPVRAARLQLTAVRVGASIRIQDSLHDGTSRFFAEITRLKHIVDLARSTDGHVLFLLDEILAGTNSHDRRLGAEALLTGLIDVGAIGLVTTHDLALGDIARQLEPRAANVHFEDRFEGDRLVFDYVLRSGVVQTSNAIPLMRSIGFDI